MGHVFTDDRKVDTRMDEDQILNVIRTNWNQLIEVFHAIVSDAGDFPHLSMFDFQKYFKHLQDDNVSKEQIDKYFILTKPKLTEDEGGHSTEMCLIRFEFWEVLVRIAKGKYFETGKEETITAAFEALIEQDILPMYDSPNYLGWQTWRDEHFYSVKVNDIYDHNL